jgi:hypothetical protein
VRALIVKRLTFAKRRGHCAGAKIEIHAIKDRRQGGSEESTSAECRAEKLTVERGRKCAELEVGRN